MLDHDDRVCKGRDSVGSAGTGETGLGIVVIADAGGVYISVGVNLSAADEGDQSLVVMKPLVCLETDETDIGPLNAAVSHETKVTYGTGYLDGGAVHQAALNDQVALGCEQSLRNGCAN